MNKKKRVTKNVKRKLGRPRMEATVLRAIRFKKSLDKIITKRTKDRNLSFSKYVRVLVIADLKRQGYMKAK